jgi:hypothetical protein
MNRFYVYGYTRNTLSENGDVGSFYYIGKGTGRRAYEEHAIHPPKDRSRIVILSNDLSESDAFQLEKDLIRQYGRIDLGTGCLHNLTDGGEGWSGLVRTPEHSSKISQKLKGRRPKPWTPEMCQAHSVKMKGRKFPPRSPEYLEHQRVAQTGKRRTPEECKRYTDLRTEYWSDISKRTAMSDKLKNREKSPEHRQKLREAALRRAARERDGHIVQCLSFQVGPYPMMETGTPSLSLK